MKKSYTIEGTIQDVYDDLGPCVRVTILLRDGGTSTLDISDLPFDEEEIKASIGKTIVIKTEAEIR